MTPGRRLRTAALGGTVARAAMAALLAGPPGRSPLWQRHNHRGAPVSLLAGPALAAGATVAAAAAAPDRALRRAALVAGLGAGLVGGYDDLAGAAAGQHADKGFRGHLRAAREGRVSAGLVKVAGVGAAGLLAAGAVARTPVERLVAGGVVAGAANLVNLLDLRPGRAVKAAALAAAPLVVAGGPGGDLVAGPLGAAAAVLPADLAERVMLGDAGANALGALLGLAAVAATGPRSRAGLLAGLVALTAASERVSFTAVIEATPALRALDRLGRRP